MSQLMKVKIMNEKQPVKIKATSNFPTVNVGGTTDHSKLKNLDYAHSGHTGFASSNDLEIKVDKVDGKQLSTEDYTTEEKNKLNSLENYDDTQIKENINEIESKIPVQASNTNQLADKEFVNSSISTNTATFRGTYNTLEELQQQQADINDYGFVISTDSSGNTLYNRYKYTGEEWVFEYSLNNSSFTANQWASINSGITSEKVSKIGENETNISNLETSKVDKITGKGLSENDYTNEEKEKLASLENYTLPIASADTLGGIKIGENLTVDENGVVSASGGGEIGVVYINDEVIDYLDNKYNQISITDPLISYGMLLAEYGEKLFIINSLRTIKISPSAYSTFYSSMKTYFNSLNAIMWISTKGNKRGLGIFNGDINYIRLNNYTDEYNFSFTNYPDYSNAQYSLEDLFNQKFIKKDNTQSYTPTSNYNPATKKYVDDNAPTDAIIFNYNDDDDTILEKAKKAYKNRNINIYYADSNNYKPLCYSYVLGTEFIIRTIPYTLSSGINSFGVTYKILNNYSAIFNIANNEISTISRKFTYGWDGYILVDNSSLLGFNNTRKYTPTGDYNPATKKYVDDKLTTITGYDATKTQTLKNINGVLTWQTDGE